MEIINQACGLDIITVYSAFDKYKELKNEIAYANECLGKIYSKHKLIKYHTDILEALEYSNSISNKEKYSETIEEFLERHHEIKEIRNLKKYIENCKEDIQAELDRRICDESSQFVLIDNSSKASLVDLNNFLDLGIDINKHNKELVEFIIEMLKCQNCFIDRIKISDLPLIMAIKEDLEGNESEEMNYVNIGLAKEIGAEVLKAHMIDKVIKTRGNYHIRTELPFIINSDEIKLKWDELDNETSVLSKEEYLLKYYKLLLLFGNDVEKVYLEANEEEKEYVIDAYYYYSSEEKNHYHFRTASPLINEEVLKRKVMNKK